jgi:hypothetical protein
MSTPKLGFRGCSRVNHTHSQRVGWAPEHGWTTMYDTTPQGLDPRKDQPVAIRYTDYAQVDSDSVKVLTDFEQLERSLSVTFFRCDIKKTR